jgi:GNAT superfamily N-acetyltransferase
LRQAAHHCLRRTTTDGDGPWVRQASFLAVTGSDPRPAGAAFVTLVPDGDPCDGDSYYWHQSPPEDYLPQRRGRPHLTWIFVAPLRAAQGTGTALLHAAARQLQEMGYALLLSTFLLGNDSSLLWHWRNGFQLLPCPASFRHIGQRFRRRRKDRG